MGKKILTCQSILWLSGRGIVSLEQPPAQQKAIAFRLEQLQQLQKWGEGVNITMGFRDDAHYGIQVFLDEVGRIVVSRFWQYLSLREMKIKVVASSAEHLAEQFGRVYDPHYYDF
jgi:hypothetical protein